MGISEDDEEFTLLSPELQSQILKNDDIPTDIENKKYDELIIIALKSEFKGVTNIFLSKCMVEIGFRELEINGTVEVLEVCPCCKYRTLESRCISRLIRPSVSVDDGTKDVRQYSSPNRMTLGEAKEVFLKNIKGLPLNKWVKYRD